MRKYAALILPLLLLTAVPGAWAQEAQKPVGTTPRHSQTLSVASGTYGAEVQAKTAAPAFRQVIYADQMTAPWMRLLFDEYHLGARSFITITSLEDGATQRMDAESIEQWKGASAFFNGAAVEVQLHVAPGDTGVFFTLAEAHVGAYRGAPSAEVSSATRMLPSAGAGCDTSSPRGDGCDGLDDRVSTTDPAVGRLFYDAGGSAYGDCTGWLISNGAGLTAGHCIQHDATGLNLLAIHFNVPASDCDGTLNFSHPDDQYPIDISSLVEGDTFEDAGAGNDWAVFALHPNSNTGLWAAVAQNKFYRLKQHVGSNFTVRITGYGNDSTPAGTIATPYYFNADRKTLQTDTGPYIELSGASHYVEVESAHSVSGSPMIEESTQLVFGIQTHVWVTQSDVDDWNVADVGRKYRADNRYCRSRGQYFGETDVSSALNMFPGASTVYADGGHPTVSEDGTIYRPYDTFQEALSSAAPGSVVSIVAGSYEGGFTIDKAVSIEAPVGTVTLGGAASLAAPAASNSMRPAAAGAQLPAAPSRYALAQNYPNPLIETTTIAYSLPVSEHVSIAVYDVLGRRMARLVEGRVRAGHHEVHLDAATWPGGTYIYRMQAGTFTQARRMIVAR